MGVVYTWCVYTGSLAVTAMKGNLSDTGYQIAESGDSLCSSRKMSRVKPVRNRRLRGASKLADW